ncbi:hypothetical protein Tco_0625351 [Tanacetum coccineum]|uniref:Uncharacterized protein n=1 Tax=Tanacetum coccineum TaxID=301880 RepID=A0ABQ4WGP3_9ASTR
MWVLRKHDESAGFARDSGISKRISSNRSLKGGVAIVKWSKKVTKWKPKSLDKGRRYTEGKRLRERSFTSLLDFLKKRRIFVWIYIKSLFPSPDNGPRKKKEKLPYAHEEAPKKTKERKSYRVVKECGWDWISTRRRLLQTKMFELVNQRTENTLQRRKRMELKEISHNSITTENISDELLEESGDMETDESEDSKDADPISGTNIPINSVPVVIKPPSIATYKIIKQGEKGVYQIVREDGTDIVYINFKAMLKDITRDDLTELYRIVMNRYGMNGPKDELEKNFVNSPEPTLSSRPTKVEVPKELPKVNMVNTSLKKLKYHLAGFDVVVKERTTPTAITEGSWGFEHTKACFRDEIILFAVEQHRLESKTFEVKMNQVLNENERLLEQVINKDIMNIIMNSSVNIASVNMHECEKCLKLESELLNKKDFIEKEIYDKLDNSVSNQSAPSFDQLFELNELKDDNDVTKHPSDLEMLKIDVEPITPKLLNNKTAHSAYIKHTQEEVTVLKDLVEHVKSKYPLDQSLESAYKYAKLVQELLTNISKTCPSINNADGKLVAVTLKNKDKRVRFTEPDTSSRNTNTKTSSSSNLVSNKPMLSSTGIKPSTSASGSQPSGNTKKDKIQQTPSNTQMNKVEAHPRKVKSNLKNKDYVVEPKGIAHMQHSKLNANYESQ